MHFRDEVPVGSRFDPGAHPTQLPVFATQPLQAMSQALQT